MMFPWDLDYVVTKIEYIPDKIKYQIKYGISTKEVNKVQYQGIKQDKYCVSVIKEIIDMAT